MTGHDWWLFERVREEYMAAFDEEYIDIMWHSHAKLVTTWSQRKGSGGQ